MKAVTASAVALVVSVAFLWVLRSGIGPSGSAVLVAPGPDAALLPVVASERASEPRQGAVRPGPPAVGTAPSPVVSPSPGVPERMRPGAPPSLRAVPLLRADGRPLLMSQAGAFRACAEKGLRLPSARELAEVVKAWGGRGLVETGGQNVQRVIARNQDGQVDEFLFDSSGALPPTGQLGRLDRHEIVSSSVDASPDHPSDIACVIKLGLVSDGMTLRCSGYYDLVNRQAQPDAALDAQSVVLCVDGAR